VQRPGTLAAGSRGSAGPDEARGAAATVPDDRESLSSTFPRHRRIRQRGEIVTEFEGGTRLNVRF
jgi:hypothetical protein